MRTARHSRTKQKLTAHLGAALREARLQTEWTQADVAERVGVATEVYGRMERGHMTPSVLNLWTLCRVLRLDVAAALGLEPRESAAWGRGSTAEDDPPRLRRLLRTLRQLDDRQLAAIGSVARSYVPSTGAESETP